jgi:hypothetical protein
LHTWECKQCVVGGSSKVGCDDLGIVDNSDYMLHIVDSWEEGVESSPFPCICWQIAKMMEAT